MATTRATTGARRVAGRRRAAWPAAFAAAGLAVLACGTGTAQAGGVDFAVCPSEVRSDVSGAYQEYLDNDGYGPEAETWALASLAHLDSGYYAQSSEYWPPSTAVTCQTGPGTDQPLIKFQPEGCPPSWLGLDIPVGGATPAIEWGTYLPEGFYTLGTPDADPAWTTVCLAPLDLVVPLVETPAASAPTPAAPVEP